jgi:predicted XRE-type DNA-binding protein
MNTARYTAHAEFLDPPRSSPDLDVRDLETRTRLMRIVTRLIAVSDLGSREIARRAGLPMQKISDLLSGRLEHLSVDELRLVYRTIDPSGTPTPP